MILVFEGCDATGKSTLIKAAQKVLLQRSLLSTVISHGRPEEPFISPLTEYLDPIISRPGGHLIFDRLHVGEDVYGPLYRGGSRLTLAQRAFIDGYLASHGALLVHVTASPATVVKRCRARGEDFLQERDITQVLDAYYQQTIDRRHWITVNSDEYDLEEMMAVAVKLVDIAITRWLTVQPLREIDTDYVGPRFPRVLFVADRPVLSEDAAPAYGALTPWPGNCAEYFFDALYDAHLLIPRRVPRVGWVNSNNDNLQKLHVELGSPPVVALGTEATKQLRHQDVPINGRVAHPQWWRRFKHHERGRYAAEIAEMTTISV